MTIPAPLLRGLAVLALLCLLPRAIATVTYLTDTRSLSITGLYAGTQLNLSAAPIAPFAAFNEILSGGGLVISQTSQLGLTSMQASGRSSAFVTPGPVVNDSARSVFNVTFQVDTPTPFHLVGYRELGLFGGNDFRLTGPGNTTIVYWTGPTGGGAGPNLREAFGVLNAGTYTMEVLFGVGLFSNGQAFDSASGRYSMDLTFGAPGVPSGDLSPALYGVLVMMIGAMIHRRMRLPGSR